MSNRKPRTVSSLGGVCGVLGRAMACLPWLLSSMGYHGPCGVGGAAGETLGEIRFEIDGSAGFGGIRVGSASTRAHAR
jgi:hypothetical protein